MNNLVDVAIVGAGPYGLSLGAHLRAAGIGFRQFGLPMQLWRQAMPAGMFLKSQGYASNLSDPDSRHTLRAFCEATGRDYADYGLPVPLETFVAYGDWFQRAEVPHLEELMVIDVSRVGGLFEISLAGGSTALARQVVVATGVQHFSHLPNTLAELPAQICTHTCAHDNLAVFAGREVAVVGAGQSALESAALLHESGASVTVLARAPGLCGTALRCRASDRSGGGCGNRKPRWARAGLPGSTPINPTCSAGCPPRGGSGPPAGRWGRPAPTGYARGWKARSARWSGTRCGGRNLSPGACGWGCGWTAQETAETTAGETARETAQETAASTAGARRRSRLSTCWPPPATAPIWTG